MKKSDAEDTYLKSYHHGEAFGELALLYNAPRAVYVFYLFIRPLLSLKLIRSASRWIGNALII
jgi:hypothetical protein